MRPNFGPPRRPLGPPLEHLLAGYASDLLSASPPPRPVSSNVGLESGPVRHARLRQPSEHLRPASRGPLGSPPLRCSGDIQRLRVSSRAHSEHLRPLRPKPPPQTSKSWPPVPPTLALRVHIRAPSVDSEGHPPRGHPFTLALQLRPTHPPAARSLLESAPTLGRPTSGPGPTHWGPRWGR